MKFAILTVSDRASAGKAADRSGPTLEELCVKDNHVVVTRKCVPDDAQLIQNSLTYMSDELMVDVILTTGGTGFSSRDVTPEATRRVIHKEATGLSIALISQSLKNTPMAMLSRLIAGIRDQTVIINFPGSVKACKECYEIVAPVLEHAVKQLHNETAFVEMVHKQMNTEAITKSKVQVLPSSMRDRHSPYPILDFNEAMRIVYMESLTTLKTEEISINDFAGCLGAILASDVVAVHPLPPFRASVKDGYAVVSSDGKGHRQVIESSILAGQSRESFTLKPGLCVRINTGAPVPEGADAVVQVEDTRVVDSSETGEESVIEIMTVPQAFQDIRPIGVDIKEGSVVVTSGKKLGPVELGLVASVGQGFVGVFRKPVVGVLSTGDELLDVGEKYRAGAVWDSNRVSLMALLHKHGYKTIDLGIVRDDPDSTLYKLSKAFDEIDVLVTTGSVSMGEKDFMKRVLEQDFGAKIHFGRVEIKPGKPTTFATCVWKGSKKLIFALPGNPVSAFVTCFLFTLPSLEALSGLRVDIEKLKLMDIHRVLEAELDCENPIKLDPRPEFLRGTLVYSSNKLLAVPLFGGQQSSRLLSVKDAEVLIELPRRTESLTTLEKGSKVTVYML